MSRCHKITLAGRIADIVPDLTAVVSAHGAISEFFGFQSGTADTECRPVVEVDPSIFTRGTEANTVAHAIGAVFLNHIFPPGQEGDTDAKSVVFIGDTVCCGAIYDVKACIIGFLIKITGAAEIHDRLADPVAAGRKFSVQAAPVHIPFGILVCRDHPCF